MSFNIAGDYLDATNKLTTAFFVCDILLNFHTGYYEGGKLILNYKMIARKYFSYWFWLDLISTAPIDQIVNYGLIGQYDSSSSANGGSTSNLSSLKIVQIVKFLRFLKVVRLLRILRLKKLFGRLEEFVYLSHTVD